MIAASTRFVGPFVALALLAAAPIWYHALASPTVEPCSGAASFLASPQIGGATVTSREPVEEGTPGAGIVDGEFASLPLGVSLIAVRVVRGFEPARFQKPTLLREFSFKKYREFPAQLVAVAAGDESLPVHWGEDWSGRSFRIRAHLFVVDREPVASPLVAGLARATSQLASGTRPVTAFIFLAVGRKDAEAVMNEQARAWFRSAWQQYDRMCPAT